MTSRIHSMANHPAVRRCLDRVLPYRIWINAAVHLILFSASYIYSILLLNGLVMDETALQTFLWTLPFVLILRTAVFQYHDLFHGLWRYVSFEDLINIIRATVISSILFYLAGLGWGRICVSEQLYFLDMTLCIFLCGGVRLIVRNFREKYFQPSAGNSLKRVLLVGPVDKLQPLVKELVGDPDTSYEPVAIVDPEKRSSDNVFRLCDVPILSVERVLKQKDRYRGLSEIIFCWPGAGRKDMDGLVQRLQAFQVPFKKLPHVEDMLAGRVRISDLQKVEIEDLLERPPVRIDMQEIQRFLNRKVVAITGGAGSIGSEICRQVAAYDPKLVLIVDRSENSIYDLSLELRERFPKTDFVFSVSSVNDASGLSRLFGKFGVDVVFHAAAYKHVPLMEAVPIESAYNNILGTYNAAKAAQENGVKRFVMISTDKAVNPTSVMGVTKRIAEMVVQSFGKNNSTRFMTVRFGNVLGSAGSVIPVFKKQLEKGRPLTVTHPDIERFFMTIPEAVQLVLQAGCMGKGGEIFVLDMGQPVKIVKLAEKLITLSGKRPYDDVEIMFSGLRPGEKMFEELFNTGEMMISTSHARIKTAVCRELSFDDITERIRDLQSRISTGDEAGLLAAFYQLVPSYHGDPEQDRLGFHRLDCQSALKASA